MSRRVLWSVVVSVLAFAAPAGCEASVDLPGCGAGTLTLEDGTCAAQPAPCEPGTVSEDGICVVADGGGQDGGPGGGPDTGPDAGPDAGCEPTCLDRACGDDGCGGQCGQCAEDSACNAFGVCAPTAWVCAASAYATATACHCGCGAVDPDCDPILGLPVVGCGVGETCDVDGNCAACEPDCVDRECGDDGCGGSCGACFEADAPYCQVGQCVALCEPLCAGHDCGPDGCGGVCGVCGLGEHCVLDRCLGLPEGLSCVGACGETAPGGCSCQLECAPGECCGDYEVACECIPQCTASGCGPDGCGGSCGSCGDGQVCGVGGACVPDPCGPSPCHGHGACDGNGACTCDLGYSGPQCGSCQPGFAGFPTCVADPCASQTCSGAGTCDPVTGACLCDAGVTGAICHLCVDPGMAWPACDTPNPCADETCSGTGVCDPQTGTCACEPGFTGDSCELCSDGALPWPNCVACVDDGQCDDGVGCTTDACAVELGYCVNLVCAGPSWVLVDHSLVPAQATFDAAAGFELLGQPVTFYRDSTWPLAPSTVGTSGGGFACGLLNDAPLVWDAPISAIEVHADPGQTKNAGTVTFDFTGPAGALGDGSRYVLGVAGLGGPSEGPTTLTSSLPLQALGADQSPSVDVAPATLADPTTLSGPAGGTSGTVAHLFVLPSDATQLTLSIDDVATGLTPDVFQVWVGWLDADTETCNAPGPTGACVANFCGDGLPRDGEDCDDGDAISGDGCSAACKVEPGWSCAGNLTSVCTPG